ncbi:competence protein CoiA [Metabacillus sp. Hm71]|uniref:competence protein CoiA n=1 Tax=Metabacillus sp. Hm71 TaxID=3450743 RepID=UPI003F433071
MFVAYDEKGILINVAEKKWSKERLIKLRENKTFRCPTCSNEMELKIGSIITAHFAHKKLTECRVKGEPESIYHMQGKQDLFEWLNMQQKLAEVQLEPYLHEIKQRPDLLFSNGDEWNAIEFQCSTIDSSLFYKRTKSYLEANMDVLWILGAKALKRTGMVSFQLTPFQWLFTRMKNPDDPLTLFSYCSNLKSFIILNSIIPFSSRSVIANHQTYPLCSTSYFELQNQHANKRKLMTAWLNKIKRLRVQAISFKGKDVAAINHFLYKTKQLPLSHLSSLAFLPLHSNYLIESPVYVWQGWILLYIESIPLHDTFTYHGVYQYMARKVREGILTIRHLPHIDLDYSFALKDYLLKLCGFSIIKQQQKNVFFKERNIHWTTSLNELLKTDEEIVGRLF